MEARAVRGLRPPDSTVWLLRRFSNSPDLSILLQLGRVPSVLDSEANDTELIEAP